MANSISEYENTKEFNYDKVISVLNDFRSQLSIDSDLSNVISNLEKAATDAYAKQTELELLSFFAFFSDHETIVEQRQQLFLTAKMLYEDKIKEIVERDYDRPMIVSASSINAESKSQAIEKRRNMDSIMDLFYSWKRKIKSIRKIITGEQHV